MPKHNRATKQEFLDFCNAFRKAGAGNPIDTVLPAVPGNSRECLVAKNMNFNCEVEKPSAAWQINIHDEDVVQRIKDSDLDLEPVGEDERGFYLPERIGQVAEDFDRLQELLREECLNAKELEELEDLKALYPYIEESVRETYENGLIVDGKLVL